MGTTVKTYSYNGSVITDTSVGIKFTDGSVSPKNWETVWSNSEKNAKGITWTTTTNYAGGSASAEKLLELREQRNMLLQECDWTQSPDSPLSSDKKTEWETYRQALRDLPSSASPKLSDDGLSITNVTYPTKPS